MPQPEVSTRPCYSMRLLRPFLNVLAGHSAIPRGLLDPMLANGIDERLPIDTVHELLRGAIELTHDPDLGLKAARTLKLGDLGAIEYIAASATSMSETFESVGRYMKLVNDALTFSLEVSGERAIVHLDNSVVMPRAAEDFEVAAFYRAIKERYPTLRWPNDAVHFTYAEPPELREHLLTFDDMRLCFSQPFTGYSFDRVALTTKLPSSDSRLYEVLRDHAERLSAELPKAETLTERVQRVLTDELPRGAPSVESVAKHLHTSTRTLARKLEQEGTSFKDLLDDLRRRLAMKHASGTDLQLSEIATRLGFSNAAAFHRAFKRWTGETPLEYRRARRG